MNLMAGILKLIKFVFRLPPIKWYRIRRYRRRFLTARGWQGLHYGIFDSFSEARAALPESKVTSWQPDDNDWYASEYQKLEIIDYPILFWLQQLIHSGSMLFDFGGHVGVTYRKYAPYLDYPDDFRWIVCEQDIVVKQAQVLLEKWGGPHLSFVTDFKLAATSTIFHSAGCVQYVEQPIATLLAELETLPQHLILSKIPLYQQATKVTLQNTGYSISPNWLFNREAFIESIHRLGYELIDSWPCPTRKNYIPFYANYNVEEMSGLYFKRKYPDSNQQYSG